MKKFLIIGLTIFSVQLMNSCSEDELDIKPSYQDDMGTIDTEEKLQMFLNNAYINISNYKAFGGEALMFGDILSDQMYTSSYLNTANFNYNELVNEFGFFGYMYSTILYCNFVIYNELVPDSENVNRMKAEAKILRAFAYFHLINSYSATPSSGQNQEYGVPLVLTGDFDVTIQPARATVAEVYAQIISDLEEGIEGAYDLAPTKNYLTKTAARLILSKVYLTRRAPGDAELALNYANQVLNNSPSVYAPISTPENPISGTDYLSYFNNADDGVSVNQPETVWELDLNTNNVAIMGIGSNSSLASYYEKNGTRSSFYFNPSFYESFENNNDIRAKTFQVPSSPTVPQLYFTKKWTRYSTAGQFAKDIKILRYSEAQLNRVEALYLTGQTATALTELNNFAASRGETNAYTGEDLLNDILTERYKEFYAEGYRFYDLKRYNLPIIRTANCTECELPANDLRFVFPISEGEINSNVNLTQYPGY